VDESRTSLRRFEGVGSAVAVIEMVKVMMMIVITDLFFPSFDFHHEMINAMKLKEATQVTHT
jgi:hypothetical protein